MTDDLRKLLAAQLREDGTPKETGYFGPLIRPDGNVSTELSAESDGILYPLLVPTLSQDEIDILLSLPEGERPPKSITQKAFQHARKRHAEGKSPFAGPLDEITVRSRRK